MSSVATEQQNNGDVAVEKVAATADAADTIAAVKEDKQIKKTEESADNGTKAEKKVVGAAVTKEQVKGAKRPAEDKPAETKKVKKDKAPPAASDCSDDDEIVEEIDEDSDIESDEYDIPYDGEDDIECDDDDDDVSGSDDQA